MKSGSVAPYVPRPYTYFELPTGVWSHCLRFMGGAAYKPSTKQLFVVLEQVDVSANAQSVVAVYQLSGF